MRGWLVFIVVVVALGAGVAYYANTQQEISTPVVQERQIIPGVSSIEYRDTEYGFSIEYPETATSSDTDFAGFLPLTQTPVKSFVLPASMSAGTNLSEAGIYIGATTTPKIVASCTASTLAGETLVGTTTINGSVFSASTSTDAAAGNVYESAVFRTVHDGRCLEIVELLHWGNIANFPEGEVVEFDTPVFREYLEKMVDTVKLF